MLIRLTARHVETHQVLHGLEGLSDGQEMLAIVQAAHNIHVAQLVRCDGEQLMEGLDEAPSHVIICDGESLDAWIGEDAEHDCTRDNIGDSVGSQLKLGDVGEEGDEASHSLRGVIVQLVVPDRKLVVVWVCVIEEAPDVLLWCPVDGAVVVKDILDEVQVPGLLSPLLLCNLRSCINHKLELWDLE